MLDSTILDDVAIVWPDRKHLWYAYVPRVSQILFISLRTAAKCDRYLFKIKTYVNSPSFSWIFSRLGINFSIKPSVRISLTSLPLSALISASSPIVFSVIILGTVLYRLTGLTNDLFRFSKEQSIRLRLYSRNSRLGSDTLSKNIGRYENFLIGLFTTIRWPFAWVRNFEIVTSREYFEERLGTDKAGFHAGIWEKVHSLYILLWHWQKSSSLDP